MHNLLPEVKVPSGLRDKRCDNQDGVSSGCASPVGVARPSGRRRRFGERSAQRIARSRERRAPEPKKPARPVSRRVCLRRFARAVNWHRNLPPKHARRSIRGRGQRYLSASPNVPNCADDDPRASDSVGSTLRHLRPRAAPNAADDGGGSSREAHIFQHRGRKMRSRRLAAVRARSTAPRRRAMGIALVVSGVHLWVVASLPHFALGSFLGVVAAGALVAGRTYFNRQVRLIVIRFRSQPYRPGGCRAASRQAGRASPGPPSRRRSAEPSRRGPARPDDGDRDTARSAGPPPIPRRQASRRSGAATEGTGSGEIVSRRRAASARLSSSVRSSGIIPAICATVGSCNRHPDTRLMRGRSRATPHFTGGGEVRVFETFPSPFVRRAAAVALPTPTQSKSRV